jgi:hypothetical protein
MRTEQQINKKPSTPITCNYNLHFNSLICTFTLTEIANDSEESKQFKQLNEKMNLGKMSDGK